MSVLISGSLLFTIALLLHLVVWRLHYPGNPIKTLILLFGAVLLSGIIFLVSYTFYTVPQYLHIVLLFFSLSICYLITYSAIEADSPSLVIVSRIARAGKEGLLFERIRESLGSDLLIEPRLKDLVESGLVDLSGSTYRINEKGRLFVLPFVVFRNFLGLGKGG
ncbi:MAG: hypothetical protein PHP73_03455 [Candidatus Omnitrophica bacterium]|nr:hypothetical protein [Candidatus Omnitrophota bacterium]